MKRRWKNRPALELALALPPRLSPKKLLHTSKNLDLKLGSGCVDIKVVGIIRIATSIFICDRLYYLNVFVLKRNSMASSLTDYKADFP